ncbi:MAG: cytochrome c biogenesis protein [Phycisphaerae bacterium]
MTQVLLIGCVLLTSGAPAWPAASPHALDLSVLRALPVQHDGRWPPLDTVARDLVESVTGAERFQGEDPLYWLLAWTFEPSHWMAKPLIHINNAELRAALHLPAAKTDFSFNELMAHEHLRDLIAGLADIEEGNKPDPLQRKVTAINDKLTHLAQIFQGRAIRPVPDPQAPDGRWQRVDALARADTDNANNVTAAWSALREAFLADDAGAFLGASRDLSTALQRLPAAYRPAAEAIAVELRYNRLRPFRTAWIAMTVGAVLAAAALWIRRRWFDGIAAVGLIAGFVILTYGLWMRWTVAGRIPASNMFESLLFLGWGMGAFAIVAMIVIRHRMVPLTASAMGAAALILADCLPMDHFIRPIAPVLMDTVWMSIHVPIIMVSYSVLALGVLVAHIQLVVMAVAPRQHRLSMTVDAMHYWYIHVGSILLTAGIATGSMWAASSWGRYWGWDPKEVWSLVALLGYLAILHIRVDFDKVPRWAYAVAAALAIALFTVIGRRFAPLTGTTVLVFLVTAGAGVFFVTGRGRFAIALKSILAFWLIIMTYVGVNYVLGSGLHSYGFGTGAVVKRMIWIGGADLALAVVCVVLYLLRRPAVTRHTGFPIVAGA